MTGIDELRQRPRVAYFSMEIALRGDVPTYAGGLGVLAGDTLRAAADLEIPMVGVTLVSSQGYFRQTIDANGRQVESPDAWRPEGWATPLEAIVSVNIAGRRVWVGGWLYVMTGHMNGAQPVLLLDTDLEQNAPDDREITRHLYGGDAAYRLRQEIVLGIGGVRMLDALSFQVNRYHMNEGHSALLTIELLRRNAYPAEEVRAGEPLYDVPRVRALCCFTTHTPIEAGHDKFGYDLVRDTLGEHIDMTLLQHLAGRENLNLTLLALNLSEYVNGVAVSHAELSQRMFPGYHVHAITNGVHPYTWTSEPFRRLYDARLPGWCHQPELLRRVRYAIDEGDLWAAHLAAKRRLIDEVRSRTGTGLSPDALTIGFARRMTAYKRPDLLFSDLDRLEAIARAHPLQIVLAGKAHPRDEPGKRLIERLHAHIKALAGKITLAYLPNYDLDTALVMISGVDVWLNTPLRPLEASGTSGMKAAFNGVPQLSILDGWWIEGCIEGVTGWAIGDGPLQDDLEAASLYDKLERSVIPLFADRSGWLRLMQGAIAENASHFNSLRMMRRYAAEAYIR